MSANRKRDPSNDPQAAVRDFVYRLRRMGYPGNVRVEFPLFTPEDVRWCAKLMDDATRELVEIVRTMGPAPHRPRSPLEPVLRARTIVLKLDEELKLRTTHEQVKKMRRVGDG